MPQFFVTENKQFSSFPAHVTSWDCCQNGCTSDSLWICQGEKIIGGKLSSPQPSNNPTNIFAPFQQGLFAREAFQLASAWVYH